MSNLKRMARFAAGAILVTGIFATGAAPAEAASATGTGAHHVTMLDTGWGG